MPGVKLVQNRECSDFSPAGVKTRARPRKEIAFYACFRELPLKSQRPVKNPGDTLDKANTAAYAVPPWLLNRYYA
jgi:hypothetical protein